MELINENNFDPTPKLKSSPVPILFLPFNNEKLRCNNCGNKYSATNLYKQKYCKQCLSSYIENITDNNIYFDVNILTNNEHCIKHKTTRNLNFFTKNIQEWCENCSEISYFKNYYDYINTIKQYIFIEKDCKLCGKLIDKISFGFKMCSDCYLISSGWIKSTITGKNIPILYLPWWDTSNKSTFCKHNLKFITDCQKWCPDCFIIYVGCRYCLTTNIIYGIIDQTQCIKCKGISNINIEFTNISSGNHDIDEFLISTRTNTDCHEKIANYKNIMNKNSDPLNVYSFIERELKNVNSKRTMEWIPYSQIKNLEKIAEGGFGIIYKAIWLNKTTVAVKRFRKSQDISKYILNFLNEVKSLHRCYDTFIVKCYGITQDPVIKDHMLIMEYASGGNLHSYLKKNFINIKWITKLAILCQISDGLKTIHQENFIHRDFHSGNILSLKNDHKKWVIGDLGLSQPADNSSNDEIYGVIPYVAPEIFQGAIFSKESDIYSLGMIMWELTTGCKPFYNIVNTSDIKLIYKVIDGKRPVITNDTPECYSNLMKRCWDSDPSKRPSITEIKEVADDWYKKSGGIFYEAEKKRLELIQLKLLHEFNEKSHPGAIYTSRPLNCYISQSSFINSTISEQDNTRSKLTSESLKSSSLKGYISKNLDFDIDIDDTRSKLISKSLKSSLLKGYISTDLEFDIDINDTRSKFTSKSLKSSSLKGYISNDLDFDIDIDNTQSKLLPKSLSLKGYISNNLDFDIEDINTQRSSSVIKNVSLSDAIYTSRPLSALISYIRKYIINSNESIYWYKEAAENEDALFNLGYCYEKGIGTEVNETKAFELYKLTAENGHIIAQNNLGYSYQYAKGTEKDLDKAIYWYNKAVESGNEDALFNLGYCCEKGIGTEINEAKAFKLYKLAAKKGHIIAQNNLGYLYNCGKGTKMDLDKAIYWYNKAAGNGVKEAQFNLGFCYDKGIKTEVNKTKAFELYKLAAEKDHIIAQNNLGHCYKEGIGTEVNETKAFKLYKPAAESGNEVTLFNLGYCYKEGIGAEVSNKTKAFELYKSAAEKGHITAQVKDSIFWSDALETRLCELYMKHDVIDIFWGCSVEEHFENNTKWNIYVITRGLYYPYAKKEIIADGQVINFIAEEERLISFDNPLPNSLKIPQDLKEKFNEALDNELRSSFRDAHYNLVGIGTGYKQIRGKFTEIPAIIFYVRQKGILRRGCNGLLPKEIRGFPTDVIEACVAIPCAGLGIDTCRRYQENVKLGSSIGIKSEKNNTTGTLSAVAYENNPPNRIGIISCEHVLNFNEPIFEEKTTIYQPSYNDLFEPKKKLEELRNFIGRCFLCRFGSKILHELYIYYSM
ncbi:unnamed protein product [Rhizophagus irregularis]|nr:unnamed protein product [Rhizophagus irregularis]